jgi:hypothetical protein
MRLVAAIEDPAVARKILEYLDLFHGLSRCLNGEKSECENENRRNSYRAHRTPLPFLIPTGGQSTPIWCGGEERRIRLLVNTSVIVGAAASRPNSCF